jgi:cellulose synthase/poly-beta-1,6-N-acetylglucosamine synthase-like glycosyltransferase
MTALDLANTILVLISAVPLLLTAIFTTETVAAALRGSGKDGRGTAGTAIRGSWDRDPPSVVVLVPAHNEAAIIAATVAHLARSLPPRSRLLVVADNCSDETAALARAAGATVVERTDPDQRGKGFALEFGFRSLENCPPDVVIVMDADCRAEPGALECIARVAVAANRPVQAVYEMRLPESAEPLNERLRIAAFAWRVKNYIRPLGLAQIGLPCNLTGAGMALPFALALKAHVGTDEIVEDLVLGLEFARDGSPPLFAPQALIHSRFPANHEGQESQRTRWETGHIQTIFHRLPSLVATAIAQRNVALLSMCADTAVPPLVSLALALLACTLVMSIAWLLLGVVAPLLMSAFTLGLLAVGVLCAWHLAGRDLVSLGDLRHIVGYVLGKPALYFGILLGRKLEWVRTRRD